MSDEYTRRRRPIPAALARAAAAVEASGEAQVVPVDLSDTGLYLNVSIDGVLTMGGRADRASVVRILRHVLDSIESGRIGPPDDEQRPAIEVPRSGDEIRQRLAEVNHLYDVETAADDRLALANWVDALEWVLGRRE